jgi:hypothetical protein
MKCNLTTTFRLGGKGLQQASTHCNKQAHTERPEGDEDFMDPVSDNCRASLSRVIMASSASLSCQKSDKSCREEGRDAAEEGAADGVYSGGVYAAESEGESGPRLNRPPASGTGTCAASIEDVGEPAVSFGPARFFAAMLFGRGADVSLSDISMYATKEGVAR